VTQPAQVRRLLAALFAAVLVAGCGGSGEPRAAEDPAAEAGAEPTGTASAQPSPAAPATSSTPPDLGRFTGQELVWQPCDDGFECTELEVPLDYDAPEKASIRLAVVRLPASHAADRLGSLVVNPGGPGASGLEYARLARRAQTEAVRARYDVVGFDPRGVGQSSPVECATDDELDALLAADGSPDSATEEQALIGLTEDFVAGCQAMSGGLLPHVGTADAARDLDVLRAALGDENLTYLGKSYGTYLGATYAELFPERVGRLVLDGALDPTLSGAEIARGQAAGFELALDAFLDDCTALPDCPLGTDAAAAAQRLEDLLAQVDSEPLTSESGRDVTQPLAALGVLAALYQEQAWPVLRNGLMRALDGDGTVLLAIADVYTDRASDGRYTSNSNEAIVAINCADRQELGDVDDLRAEARRLQDVSPLFAAVAGWAALPCLSWPVPASPPRPVSASGADPILVVGTTRDPATPYAWSVALAEQLESGALLTYEGDGHTAYVRGSACVDAAVDAYLVEGTLPDSGARCT
jgi:pimeloyl-ACP methyl ester carboxylesterase